ncbi:MAG: SMI1/KNR4 family protein [Sphingomicrobium sp.]
MEEFLTEIENKAPPAPPRDVARLERSLGSELPTDYRDFLGACNGGYVGGALWFEGPTPAGEVADVGVHHIGGFRDEYYFSLDKARDTYKRRIPADLLWIMDDPFGNAICLGIGGEHRDKVYFWDHELEPDQAKWDGRVETAGNLILLTNSFRDFVAGLKPVDREGAEGMA